MKPNDRTTDVVQAATATTSLSAGSEKAASPSRTARTTFQVLASLAEVQVDGCAEVPPTVDGLDQAYRKQVHAAGETSARVNSKAEVTCCTIAISTLDPNWGPSKCIATVFFKNLY